MAPVECLPRQIATEAARCLACVRTIGAKLLGLLSGVTSTRDGELSGLEQCRQAAEGKSALLAAKTEASAARQAHLLAQHQIRDLQEQVENLSFELDAAHRRAEVCLTITSMSSLLCRGSAQCR